MCTATTATTAAATSPDSPRSTAVLPLGTDDPNNDTAAATAAASKAAVSNSSATDARQLWGTLADRCVCINLRERPDRRAAAERRFAQVGLGGDLMTYFRPERHPRGGRYGCYSSHRDCLRQAYEDGLHSVLIFEDDVVFRDGWEQVVADAHAFVHSANAEPFDALFLGSKILFVDEPSRTVPDRIWRVKCFEAHAYLVSRQGMKAYLDGGATHFEPLLADHGQDLIHNSLWPLMYAHAHTNAIVQDDALGTDHIWVPELPAQYAEWMQFVVSPAHKRAIQPLVRSRWWQRSYWGRRFIFGIDNYVIDDGRVRLKGLWLADAAIHAFLMNCWCEPPPQGRWAVLRDGVKATCEHWPGRFRDSARACCGALRRSAGSGNATKKS